LPLFRFVTLYHYFQILTKLTSAYGSSSLTNTDTFAHLYVQPYPTPSLRPEGVAQESHLSVLCGDGKSHIVRGRPKSASFVVDAATGADGSRNICSLLTSDQISRVYQHVLREKKLLVTGSCLGYVTSWTLSLKPR
jgi:hypothetical protein